MSVWSRGRYLMFRLSSSASTSSGMRPFTRTAYMPRTYLAKCAVGQDCALTRTKEGSRTYPLPPGNPACFWVYYRNHTIEVGCGARLHSVRSTSHLQVEKASLQHEPRK